MSETPLACVELDLVDPVAPSAPPGWGMQVLVRLQGRPVGLVTIPAKLASSITLEGLIARARAECAPLLAEIESFNGRDPHPLEARSTAASVIVGTVGSRPTLQAALQALLDQDFVGDLEIVVVDNRPANSTVRDLLVELADDRLVYVAEPRVGISYARNTGVRSARHDLLLFTDDDAMADPSWVRSTVAVFDESPRVAGVTGLVLPASLATPAEQEFEKVGSFAKGFRRFVWSDAPDPSETLGPPGDGGPLFPFSAGWMGSGNSMAFRRSAMELVGGFDGNLRTGQDLDYFCRVILSGGIIIYEPRVLVRHYHRDTTDALMLQTRRYGMGLSALLTKQFLASPINRRRMVNLVPTGTRRYLAARKSANAVPGQQLELADQVSRRLQIAELTGLATGPVHYLWTRSRKPKTPKQSK